MIETNWMPRLEQRVAVAAAQGGLPQLRSPHAAFDGDEWRWEWRDCLYDDKIAADVRLRMSTDEPTSSSFAVEFEPRSRDLLRASVSGLAWPVALDLRRLSRLAYSSSRDTSLNYAFDDEDFWDWLTDRLRTARVKAREAAEEVLSESVVQRL